MFELKQHLNKGQNYVVSINLNPIICAGEEIYINGSVSPVSDVEMLFFKDMSFISVSFSYLPSQEVLNDLLAIRKNPGFKVHELYPGSNVFHIFCPGHYLSFDVATEITRCFREEHGLSVNLK